MQKATFKIRRKIIIAFLFSLLSVLIFSIFSFQIHREIGHRLRLLELTDDLFQTILELRRVEKNFFLYRQVASLREAETYLKRVEDIYHSHEPEILRLKKTPAVPKFPLILNRYQEILSQVNERLNQGENQNFAPLEETLRHQGQELLNITEKWVKEERLLIDRLFQRAMILFIISVVVFLALGIVVAFYLSRMLVQPLVQMQQAMDKIAHGDFTPLPEPEPGASSEEFFALFRAFNRMIHELEEHQEQLVQSRKIAAVGTLTSGIAHELNNPINNIVLTAESLKEDFEDLAQEDAMALIQDILIQSERASEIVKGLLDFSRAERPEFEALSIGAVVQDTLKLVRNQLTLSGIHVEQDIPPNLPPIHGERKSLQQVFLNLFINAIQAMLDGGTLHIRASSSADGQWMIIDVTDTGVGIEPEHLPQIFDPFYTTKQVGRGTGLGLSVTYGIVEKHGGHIEVKSRKGEGTTFTVTLPLHKAT